MTVTSLFSIAEDHALLVSAVREAGALALRYFKNGAKSWNKADDSPVTEADLAVNTVLKARLTGAHRPGYGWLSEETEDDPARLASERLWVVDPIDGTRAFVKGEPHFTVSVAIVSEGRPLAAGVYNPAREEMFEAVAGRGARLNGQPIRVSDRRTIAGARLICNRRLVESPRWRTPWPEVSLGMVNSVAYRAALVAEGRFDAMIRLGPIHDWDIAAAELIVREAGGRASTHRGMPFRYNRPELLHRSLIAAGPALQTALLSKMEELPLDR